MSRRLRTLGLLGLALSAGPLAAALPAADGVGDAELATHLAQLAAAELAGPNLAERRAGLSRLFPEAARLDRVQVASGRGEIGLALPPAFLASGVDDLFLDAVAEWMEALAE